MVVAVVVVGVVGGIALSVGVRRCRLGGGVVVYVEGMDGASIGVRSDSWLADAVWRGG